MAIKVFEEEQTALLTEDQRKQYEETLALYQERTSFVERMADLESVEIPVYKPMLREISMMGEIPENDYEVPEWGVKKYVPAFELRPEFREFSFHASISVELPECRKPTKMEVNYLQRGETVRAELPKAVIINNPSVHMKRTKQKPPYLPEIVPPDIAEIFFEGPGKAEVVLPEVEIGCFNIKGYKKPELAPNKVPAVKKPDYIVKSRKAMPVCAVLPELPDIQPLGKEYKKPEISETEIPKVLKTNVPDYEVVPAEYFVQDLPIVKKPKAGFKQSGAREISPVKYRKNTQKPKLPMAEKISPANIVFKPVEMSELKMKRMPVTLIRVKAFAKVESRANELPELAAVTIPDGNVILKELLPEEFLFDKAAETAVLQG